jgi:hypothetical protein
VGLDVVRRDVSALGGEVSLESRPGAGTTVRLALPISMTITRVLLVSVSGEMFGVPMENVVAAVRVQPSAIRGVKQSTVFVFRERLIPLLWLSRLLDLSGEAGGGADTGVAVLIVRVQDVEVGLAVDAFQEDMDIILKPFSGIIAGCRGYLGTAILGDGRALLVLNLLTGDLVMALRYADGNVVLSGVVSVEEAEALCGLLCEHTDAGVDLGACLHLHTAALQVLLCARRKVVAPPEDLFLELFIAPLLAAVAPAQEPLSGQGAGTAAGDPVHEEGVT